MNVNLESRPGGLLLCVRAHAGARRSGILGTHDGALKVAVSAAPEKGKANQAIVDVLCEELSLSRGQITLSAGETSRQKKFLIGGIDRDELIRRIAARLGAS